jgi:hypothetical protein
MPVQAGGDSLRAQRVKVGPPRGLMLSDAKPWSCAVPTKQKRWSNATLRGRPLSFLT